MKIRINYVCIIGASIGLMSVFLTWATVVIDHDNSIHWIGSGYLPPSPDDIPPGLLIEVLEVEDWSIIDFVMTTGPSPHSHNSEIQLQIQSYCLIFLIGTFLLS